MLISILYLLMFEKSTKATNTVCFVFQPFTTHVIVIFILASRIFEFIFLGIVRTIQIYIHIAFL
jgi:hypothetical protein